MRFALICSLLLSFAGAAYPGGLQVAGPLIVLEPNKVDFGTVKQETELHATITIRNEGTETLDIGNVKSDCGCTVASLADSALAPGQSVPLDVTLSTRHFSGHITKTVTLTTNDPAAPQAQIRLYANVRFTVRVVPPDLDFKMIPRGKTTVQSITMKSAAADNLHILKITVPQERFRADYSETTEGDTTVQVVNFTVRSDAPVGRFRDEAIIETSNPLAATLRIQLEGMVQSFFAVEPPELILGQVRQGTTRERTVTLRGTGAGSHVIKAATCSDPRLGVTTKTLEEGRAYEVTVSVPPTIEPGRIDATVRIVTDDPAQPEIRVAVRGMVRRAPGK